MTESEKPTLASITIRNGVNLQGDPFCKVEATGSDGSVLVGQITPDEVRDHAMAYLHAAEAAEQDAATLRVIRKIELPDELAGAIITELRKMREDEWHDG